MVKTEIPLYLFLILLTAYIGSAYVTKVCQTYNNTRGTLKDNSTNTNCSGDFYVNVTGTESPKEGEDVNLTCVHNFPDEDVRFTWLKENDIIEGENKKELVLKSVLLWNNGKYICVVNSTCGCEESSPYNVKVRLDNPVIIIIVCGVSALGLIVIMGLIMKFKLKRDNVKHKERRRQRAQNGQGGGPNPLTPRPHN